MNNENKPTIIAVASVIAIAVGFVVYMSPKWNTESTVKRAAYVSQNADTQTGTMQTRDAWGNLIHCVRTLEPDGMAIAYQIRSAGRDETMMTKDDIVYTEVDWNKSKIAGKWIGKKSKEAATGVVAGWKSESKFAKTEEQSKGFTSKIKGIWDKLPDGETKDAL